MFKRICALIAMLALVLSGLAFVAQPASAAKKHHVDRRPCVSRAEFRAAHRPMTMLQVRHIFDIPGAVMQRFDDYIYDGYWDSYYVDDGYWQDEDYDGDGIPDDSYYVDLGYWVDNWIDTSYTMTDIFKSYRKCRDRNFDRGRGRVALNFDNYSSYYAGLRVFSKFRNNPWSAYARSVVDAKDHPADKTAKNTPAPHAKLKRTVIKP